MTTPQSPIFRQPTQLDYASPTQFKFGINQLPKVEFFTTQANVPGISLADAVFPTPYKDIPVMGDKLTYENLTISFLVDENLENYISLHEWMTGIGFPKSRTQFSHLGHQHQIYQLQLKVQVVILVMSNHQHHQEVCMVMQL